ncbi:MAG: DUF4167 domain-containing protein [Pseudomonadota bacterium]
MRQGQQHRRGRGRNNNNHNNRKHQNPLTRSFESNGPDVKIRGTPSHVAEKYVALARDALSSGDPVLAENYLQHAEHYNRIIMAYREQQAQQAEQNGRNRPNGEDGQSDQPSQGDGERGDRAERSDRGAMNGNGFDHANGDASGSAEAATEDGEGGGQSSRGRNPRGRRNSRERPPREPRGEGKASSRKEAASSGAEDDEAATASSSDEQAPDFLKRPIRRSRKSASAETSETNASEPELAHEDSSD